MATFALQLAKFSAKTKGRTDAVIRKTILDLGNRLVERSPVGDPSIWQSPPPPGYVGGRFRANWQYGFGAAPSGALEAIDPSGAATRAKVGLGIASAPAAGIHYLVNNLPYAERIELGWSTQAPVGVVGLTVAEFKGIVTEALR